MIIFPFVLCSARVPLMKRKWRVIGFWQAAKRTAKASGVGRSSRPSVHLLPPEKRRTVVRTPGVRAGRGVCSGKLCVYVRQEEALQAEGECVRSTGGGSVCARVCVRACLCVYVEVRYMSRGESAVVILSHHPPLCLQQTNKQQHGTQQAALPRQTTDISEESMFLMNNEIPTQKNTSLPTKTNTYTCCTPHRNN